MIQVYFNNEVSSGPRLEVGKNVNDLPTFSLVDPETGLELDLSFDESITFADNLRGLVASFDAQVSRIQET